MIIKPPRLEKGQDIGIIAPAGPVLEAEVQPGIDLLASMGYSVILSPHLFDRQGYLAGVDEDRLEDFHAMFQDGNIKAIFCARGGYGSLRLLEKINYDLIRENPKIFIGYSDITALLLAIHKMSGVVTFHGPMVKELSGNRNQSAFDLVSSERLLGFPLSDGVSLLPGKAAGTLLGGNLSLLCHLVGTPFMPSLEGALLFVEETGEPLYRIDRMLTHLRMSGLLENLAGLIAGRFVDCGDMSSINQLLVDIASNRRIPVVSGLAVGHCPQNTLLPLGVRASLDAENMSLSIMEPGVA